MASQQRLLIADDSLATSAVIRKHLANTEFGIAGEARNGKEAVAKFKELSPDIVILDLVMPDVDGKTALRQIMEMAPDAVVIIASSLGTQADVEECLSLGAKTFLQKPFEPARLIEALRAVTKG